MYLVTGGSGFLGQALVKQLSALGHGVRVLDRESPANPLAGVEYIQGDLLDEEALFSAIRGVSGVYHLAAIPHLWSPDPGLFERVNAQGTCRVVEACLQQASQPRLVHVSSESIYLASGWDKIGNELPRYANMVGPYTRSKWKAHLRVLDAVQLHGLEACVVVPSTPIGTEDPHETPPTRMLKDFAQRKHPAYLDCLLNLVTVEEVVGVLIGVMDHGSPGETYLANRQAWWMHEILDLLQRELNIRKPKLRIPYSMALSYAFLAERIGYRVFAKAPPASMEAVRLAKHPLALVAAHPTPAGNAHDPPALKDTLLRTAASFRQTDA